MRRLLDADVFLEREGGEVDGFLDVGGEAGVAGFGPAGPEGRGEGEGAGVAEFERGGGGGVFGDVVGGDLGGGVQAGEGFGG